MLFFAANNHTLRASLADCLIDRSNAGIDHDFLRGVTRFDIPQAALQQGAVVQRHLDLVTALAAGVDGYGNAPSRLDSSMRHGAELVQNLQTRDTEIGLVDYFDICRLGGKSSAIFSRQGEDNGRADNRAGEDQQQVFERFLRQSGFLSEGKRSLR